MHETNKSKRYKNMSNVGIEPKWFVNSRMHTNIPWFGHMHYCHLALIQACHLGIMNYLV